MFISKYLAILSYISEPKPILSSILCNLLDNKKSAITILKIKISKLTDNDLSKIVRNALKYPPRATALLRAILEFSKTKNSIESLRANLNPLTSYNIGIKEQTLPTAPKWSISYCPRNEDRIINA